MTTFELAVVAILGYILHSDPEQEQFGEVAFISFIVTKQGLVVFELAIVMSEAAKLI
jgi:hypothetical protein